MPVGGPSARAFGLRGGIPMEAAHTNVYHEPAPRAGITRPIQMHITHPPPTCEGARGAEAPSIVSECACTRRICMRTKCSKGEETGGTPVSREDAALRSTRAPYPRPLTALSRRFRSGTGVSVLPVCPGPYTAVCVVGSRPP